MDNTIVIAIVVVVGIVVTAIATYLAAGNKPRPFDFSDALDEFRQAVELVEKFAPAADQLVALQELPKNQRRTHVIEMVKKVLPNIDPKIIGMIVEWWVAIEQPKIKQDAPTPPAAPGV